jgi:hypothetical protein
MSSYNMVYGDTRYDCTIRGLALLIAKLPEFINQRPTSWLPKLKASPRPDRGAAFMESLELNPGTQPSIQAFSLTRQLPSSSQPVGE